MRCHSELSVPLAGSVPSIRPYGNSPPCRGIELTLVCAGTVNAAYKNTYTIRMRFITNFPVGAYRWLRTVESWLQRRRTEGITVVYRRSKYLSESRYG